MKLIEIINSQRINQENSAFPTLVKLNSKKIICAFCVGGGPKITGGTKFMHSGDGGETWEHGGIILPETEDPVTANSMRVSKTNDGTIVAYGQKNYLVDGNTKFGDSKNEAVFCTSDDGGMNWSEAAVVLHQCSCPVEVSNPIVTLSDGRWLAPAALLTDENRLGERVIVTESTDQGKSWNNSYTVFEDPEKRKGFFEQKIIETEPGKLLAFAWTVELGSYLDYCNHFAWSYDGGRTWSKAVESSIPGQTLSPYFLEGNRFLLIYNCRRKPQGIKLALAEIDKNKCNILFEEYLWETLNTANSSKPGIDSFDDFAFGLPSITPLSKNNYLAVFWNMENGLYGIRTIKFRLSNF